MKAPDIDSADEVIDDVAMDALARHPDAFRVLVNECKLPPRTAIQAIVQYRLRIDKSRDAAIRRIRNWAIAAGAACLLIKLVQFLGTL